MRCSNCFSCSLLDWQGHVFIKEEAVVRLVFFCSRMLSQQLWDSYFLFAHPSPCYRGTFDILNLVLCWYICCRLLRSFPTSPSISMVYASFCISSHFNIIPNAQFQVDYYQNFGFRPSCHMLALTTLNVKLRLSTHTLVLTTRVLTLGQSSYIIVLRTQNFGLR